MRLIHCGKQPSLFSLLINFSGFVIIRLIRATIKKKISDGDTDVNNLDDDDNKSIVIMTTMVLL